MRWAWLLVIIDFSTSFYHLGSKCNASYLWLSVSRACMTRKRWGMLLPEQLGQEAGTHYRGNHGLFGKGKCMSLPTTYVYDADSSWHPTQSSFTTHQVLPIPWSRRCRSVSRMPLGVDCRHNRKFQTGQWARVYFRGGDCHHVST